MFVENPANPKNLVNPVLLSPVYCSGQLQEAPIAFCCRRDGLLLGGANLHKRGEGYVHRPFLERAFPEAAHAPADQEHRQHHAVGAGVRKFCVLRIEHGAAVGVAEQVFVKAGQQVDGSGEFAGIHVPRAGGLPIRLIVKRHLLQVRSGGSERGAGVGQREAAPPGEVLDGGGAVAPEVAAGEFGQGFVAAQPAGVWDPLVQQGERKLLAAARAQAEQPLLRQVA